MKLRNSYVHACLLGLELTAGFVLLGAFKLPVQAATPGSDLASGSATATPQPTRPQPAVPQTTVLQAGIGQAAATQSEATQPAAQFSVTQQQQSATTPTVSLPSQPSISPASVNQASESAPATSLKAQPSNSIPAAAIPTTPSTTPSTASPSTASPSTTPLTSPPTASSVPPSLSGTPPQSTPSASSESQPAPLSTSAVKILSPVVNTVLDLPAATVIVQYLQGEQLELRVNGTAVPAGLVGRTEVDSKTQTVTQIWYGVPLKEGSNRITAQVIANGTSSTPASVDVQVRGAIKQITVTTVEARIPADGRSQATVQGQLLDAQGNRSNRDALVTLVSSDGEWVGTDADTDQPGFQVQARQGQFSALLRSSLTAKTVNIRASSEPLEAFTQLRFDTSLRPSIATGVIDIRFGKRGTDFYRSFRDFLPADGKNGYQLDFQAAAFATGRIGNWLFTGAYNSTRPLNSTCDGTSRLFRDSQSCDQNYPVYGDSSQSSVLTPSTDSLYLRLERTSPVPKAGTDYVMWGDYNTEEFATRSQEFTATTRRLHGFKANYNLGNLQITGMYGNNIQGFQRDAIAPDGTSGYYFLSRRLLVEGSENVFLELEELNRPGTVLERKQLNRGPDYEIDYDRGTLLFRQPILRTDIGQDGEPLVRRIIVTYQYDTPGSDSNLYAARLQYHLSRQLNRESWIGATYLRENQGSRNFEIYGGDAYISLGSTAHLIAEYAHSSNVSDVLGLVSGSAYRLELEGEITKGITGRAYYRSADSGFANNATISFVPGQTRYGAQVTAEVSTQTHLRLQYDHEDNHGIAPRPLNTLIDLFTPRTDAVPGTRVDNALTTLSAGIQQKIGSADLTVDWLHRDRQDRLNSSANTISDQVRSRLTVPLTHTLTFLAQNETTLSSQKDAVYADRSLLGLNWAVMPGINVQLAQQFYSSGQFAGQSITSLAVNGDYKLGPDTTLSGRYMIVGGANQITTQGAIGLNQRIKLAPGLRMDLAYEHVFGNFLARTGAGTQFLQPFATGQSAASLGVQGGDSYSIGLEYSDNPNFQASARFEHRTSSEGSNTVITAGALGKLSPALTALIRYQQASSANQKLTGLGSTATLKVGLAYRDPHSDKFNALLRYEYRKNPATIPDTILLGNGTGSTEHLFALEAIYAPNWRWEFYGKFALRTSSTYLAKDWVGSSTTTLSQLRATYHLGYRWDVVGEARWINQPSTGYSETGFVLEAGYYLTPNLRLSAGYSFGGVRDRDLDGTRSTGGPYVGLTVKLNELFGGFGLQKLPPAHPPDRSTKPVATSPSAPTGSAEIAAISPLPASEASQPAHSDDLPVSTPRPLANVPVVPGTAATSAQFLLDLPVSFFPVPDLSTP